MTDDTFTDEEAQTTADAAADTDATERTGRTDALAASSTYKVLGDFDDADGAGVLGRNRASTGNPVGVEGAVPNANDGFGLSTPHDARIQGVLDTNGSDFVVDTGTGTPRNVVLGAASNRGTDGLAGATVGGGARNVATSGSDYATIAGGTSNSVEGAHGTVGGGKSNEILGDSSTIGGGVGNSVDSVSLNATIGGGTGNEITSNADQATIGGGNKNRAMGIYSTVAGGWTNDALADFSTVGGGVNNQTRAAFGTVAGGGPTDLTDKPNTKNVVYDDYGTVGGGGNNQAGSNDSTSNAAYATVGGGKSNTASARAATVPGGQSNTAGGAYSLAAGRKANAADESTFVWADGATDSNGDVAPFESNAGTGPTGKNTFHVRCVGGARFVSGVDSSGNPQNGVKLASGGGGWNQLSTRAVKSDVRPVDPTAVLEDLRDLEIATWEYDSQEDVRHIGPMAGPFHEAFGVGEDPETINTVDADGVALAAIQGLSDRLDDERRELRERLAEKDDRIDTLEREKDRLRERLAAVETRLGIDEAPGPSDD